MPSSLWSTSIPRDPYARNASENWAVPPCHLTPTLPVRARRLPATALNVLAPAAALVDGGGVVGLVGWRDATANGQLDKDPRLSMLPRPRGRRWAYAHLVASTRRTAMLPRRLLGLCVISLRGQPWHTLRGQP